MCCAIVLQKPITNFSFPFAPLINWFPEADVLKKRDTLRKLVLSLQSRLNPDLQCDLQQGTVPAAPVVPETSISDMTVGDVCVSGAEDTAVLNTVAAASDADSDGLLQTTSEQFATSDHDMLEASGNHMSVPVLPVRDCFAEDGATDINKSTPSVADNAEMAKSVTAQTITTSTTSARDTSLGMSTLALSDLPVCLMLSSKNSEMTETTVSDGVCHGASVSTCSFAAMSSQDRQDHSVVLSVTDCGHLASERTGSVADADAGPAAVSTGKPSTAGSIGNSMRRASDASSCAEDGSFHCIVPRVNESLVSGAELQNSSCDSTYR